MKISSFIAALLLVVVHFAGSQTRFSDSMDWTSGYYRLLASRPLDSGMSPSDHPRALRSLEQELIPLVRESLGQLVWDSSGTMAHYAKHQTDFRLVLDKLVGALNREWSRLSFDRKSVEAEYTVDIALIAGDWSLDDTTGDLPVEPIGWIPVPDDPWTGIIVYAPSDLPIRGTGLTANPRKALKPRILDPDLNSLTSRNKPLIPWYELNRRDELESLVGRRPYRVMARELYGRIPCDLIIGMEDARRIMASESGRKALSESRIVILIDN